MEKRGTSQVDWIISLALFLLYISWFFAFLTPQLKFDSNKDALMLVLQNEFKEEYEWELTRFPLFINSNLTGLQPVVMNFTNQTDIKFMDNTELILWNNKLIFLANISNEFKQYWVLSGGDYAQSYQDFGLNIEEDSVSTENLSVKFDDYMPDTIYYKDDEKIDNLVYFVNTIDFEAVETNYSSAGFAAFYKANTENINHTSIVFYNTPEIWNYLTFEFDPNLVFEIQMDLEDYDSYFSNNNYYGDLTYTEDKQNISYTYDYITFYGSDALTMYFDGNVNLNFSYFNETIELTITIPITKNYNYRFVFHEGDYNDIERSYYDARIGITEDIKGIYLNNISTNYSYLKSKWNFQKDFRIDVYENSSAYIYATAPSYEIGNSVPGSINVYAQSKDYFALSNNGELTPISVNYRVW